MIVAENSKPLLSDFCALMRRVDVFLNEEAKNDSNLKNTKGGWDLEPFVRDAAVECAKGTPFEGSIELVSGSSFPDIVAAKYFGIEVKSTQQNHWKSIGSSILESTRISSVERLFLTFGKLGHPIEFISKPYEQCLSGIAVTHYPRYQIDMTLKSGETIFDKMGVTYDELRMMSDPVAPVANYYKKQLKVGESLWWAGNQVEAAVPATVKLWSALSSSEKDYYEACSYVFFPECILSHSSNKYSRMTLWLATQCGIIHTSTRDSFSAGGKQPLKDENNVTHDMPQVFSKVLGHIEDFKSVLLNTPPETLMDFWGEPIEERRVPQWIKLVVLEEKRQSVKNVAESVLRRMFNDVGLL